MKLTDRLRNLVGLSSVGQQTFNLDKAKKRFIKLIESETRRASPVLDAYVNTSMRSITHPDLADEEALAAIQHRARETRLISKESPAVIGKGSMQLVLQLGKGAVAKIVLPEDKEKQEFQGHYVVPLRKGYMPFTMNMPALLEKIGYGDIVPPHHYFDVRQDRKGRLVELITPKPLMHAKVVITSDLTNRPLFKKYVVAEYADREQCANHEQLTSQGEAAIDKLMALYDLHRAGEAEAEYGIGPISHHAEWNDDPRIAMSKMLLVQIEPKTTKGRLVFGDLDHIGTWVMQDIA